MAERRAGGCSPGPFLPPDPRRSVRPHHCPQPRCGEGRSGGTEMETVAQRLAAGNGSLRSENENQKKSQSESANGDVTSSLR